MAGEQQRGGRPGSRCEDPIHTMFEGASAAAAVSPKLFTLVIASDGSGEPPTRVLLGKKLRGVGEGKINGFGGKVEPGESCSAAAAREFTEETGGCTAVGLERRGVLTFHGVNGATIPWEVHTYYASGVEGIPATTDEMSPLWFDVHDIPYGEMWPDDPFWYPIFLRGESFVFEGWFDDETMLRHTVDRVDVLPPERTRPLLS